jgi:hypothetical protein
MQTPQKVKMIQLGNLVPTQRDVRSHTKIVEYVQRVLTCVSQVNPIKLWDLNDGNLYVHDGHTRLLALWITGVRELTRDYFKIQRFSYKDLDDINFDVGWVTPFFPMFEVRRADLKWFKSNVDDLRKNRTEDIARHYIRTNRSMYTDKRIGCSSISDMWNLIKERN